MFSFQITPPLFLHSWSSIDIGNQSDISQKKEKSTVHCEFANLDIWTFKSPNWVWCCSKIRNGCLFLDLLIPGYLVVRLMSGSWQYHLFDLLPPPPPPSWWPIYTLSTPPKNPARLHRPLCAWQRAFDLIRSLLSLLARGEQIEASPNGNTRDAKESNSDKPLNDVFFFFLCSLCKWMLFWMQHVLCFVGWRIFPVKLKQTNTLRHKKWLCKYPARTVRRIFPMKCIWG